MLDVFVVNLRESNIGEEIGEWVSLPCDVEELEKFDVYRIDDYQTDIEELEIPSFVNLEKLNDFAEQFEELERDEKLVVRAYLYEYGVNELLRGYDSIDFNDSIIYYDVNDMSEVAYQYYEQTGMLDEITQVLPEYYIDFDAIGRDMEYDGTFVFLDDENICIQFY